jgi:hypothetical protein
MGHHASGAHYHSKLRSSAARALALLLVAACTSTGHGRVVSEQWVQSQEAQLDQQQRTLLSAAGAYSISKFAASQIGGERADRRSALSPQWSHWGLNALQRIWEHCMMGLGEVSTSCICVVRHMAIV